MATGESPQDHGRPRRSLNEIIAEPQLHPREKSLILCQRINEFVNRVTQEAGTGPTLSVQNSTFRSVDITADAGILTLLCAHWVDDRLRLNSRVIRDLMWKVAKHADVIRIQVFSMVEGLRHADTELIHQSGRKLFAAILFLSHICGEVSLAAWFYENRQKVEDGDHHKINIDNKPTKLPDVSIDLVENFLAGCTVFVAQAFDHVIDYLLTSQHRTKAIIELSPQPGLFISESAQVTKHLLIVYTKMRGFMQRLLDWGVGRAASEDERRPMKHNEAIYWRLQMMLFRLKYIIIHVTSMGDTAISLVGGCTTARQRLTQFCKTLNCLCKQLLILHYMALPTTIDDLKEAEAGPDDQLASAYTSSVENFTLLTETQARDLQHIQCDVSMAIYKLIGHLNIFS